MLISIICSLASLKDLKDSKSEYERFFSDAVNILGLVIGGVCLINLLNWWVGQHLKVEEAKQEELKANKISDRDQRIKEGAPTKLDTLTNNFLEK